MKKSILFALLLTNFILLSALDLDLMQTTNGDNTGSITEEKKSKSESNNQMDMLKKNSTILKQGSLIHSSEFKLLDTVMIPSLKKNTLYATLAPGGYSIIGGNYERLFMHNPENIIKYIYGRIGAGYFAEFFGRVGLVYSGSLGGIIGDGKNHLEVYLGAASFYSSSESLQHYFYHSLSNFSLQISKTSRTFCF